MSHLLRTTIRALLFPLRFAWRRPFVTVALVFLAAGIAALSMWVYARMQWQAALNALDEDRPQDARARLALPLALWRWNPEVHVMAARAARMSGDLPGAEALLNRSLQLAGGATELAQLEFLLLRVQTGEVDQVSPALIEAADKGHAEAPLILSTLTVAYVKNLRYRPAYACLSRWIELRPDAVKAYQFRGWVLERMNRHKEAMADYQKALELDPEQVPVRLAVAEMLLEDNQPQKALPHLERLYQQVPDHPLVQARLGACRFLQGNAKEARRLMEAAIVHLPNDPPLQIQLARLDLQEGRTDEAEKRLRRVVQADPSDMEAYFALYNALEAQGRSDEAAEIKKEYERAKVVLDRTNTLLREVVDGPKARVADYVELGQLLVEIKQENRGLFWLYEALERDPDNQQAHRLLVAYYERKGDLDKAAAHRRHLQNSEDESNRSALVSPPQKP
jgi:tetratricopeptide (TPR) repeat protein